MEEGSGRGSSQTFCRNSGSGRVNVSPGRVGSKKSDPRTTLRYSLQIRNCNVACENWFSVMNLESFKFKRFNLREIDLTYIVVCQPISRYANNTSALRPNNNKLFFELKWTCEDGWDGGGRRWPTEWPKTLNDHRPTSPTPSRPEILLHDLFSNLVLTSHMTRSRSIGINNVLSFAAAAVPVSAPAAAAAAVAAAGPCP